MIPHSGLRLEMLENVSLDGFGAHILACAWKWWKMCLATLEHVSLEAFWASLLSCH